MSGNGALTNLIASFTRRAKNNRVAGSFIPIIEDLFPAGMHRVLRGGSWLGKIQQLRVAGRSSIEPQYTGRGVGFRCVASP